jgi:hypothetical protein
MHSASHLDATHRLPAWKPFRINDSPFLFLSQIAAVATFDWGNSRKFDPFPAMPGKSRACSTALAELRKGDVAERYKALKESKNRTGKAATKPELMRITVTAKKNE